MIEDLTDRSPDGVLWSRVNTAEAAPGVMTPMTWTYYVYMLETAAKGGFHELGIIPAEAAAFPLAVEHRLFGCFYGRYSSNVDVVRRLFGSLPGVSGDEVERDLLGSTRPGVVDNPYPHRAPFIAAGMGNILLRRRHEPARKYEENRRWWGSVVDGRSLRAGVYPRAALRESLQRFERALGYQAWMRMLFQSTGSGLTALAEHAGEPSAVAALLAGEAGTEEAAVADDLWRLAHGEQTMARFLGEHGYHGPNGGDPASRVWREDTRPLERLLEPLSRAEPPRERRARSIAERERVTGRLLDGLPAHRRPGAKLLVGLAPVAARGLERNKTSFLITIDVGRAAVRARGAELVAAGRLEDPDHAFQLFADELLADEVRDFRDLAAERLALHERNRQLDLPETWEGQPEARPRETRAPTGVSELSGLGVSSGVYEGVVRVVRDAAEEIEMELGEVLVCPTTDPSWVSLMTLAGALVIDIGAAASHGAIVARELGVPCVIGTRSGSRELQTGDLVRVDGSAGTVTVVSRSASGPTEPERSAGAG
jgi:pyruvate,water dikinase